MSLRSAGPSPFLVVVIAAVFALTPRADAAEFVLTPLVSDSTVTAKQKIAMFQLMASELDFAPEIDLLHKLETPPPGLNDACLANVRCLSGIAASNESTAVITGKMTASSGYYVLDLVYFQDGAILRRQRFNVPQDPTAAANAMTPILRELLTGVSPLEEAASGPSMDDFGDDEDSVAAAPPRPTPRPAPRPSSTPSPAPAPASGDGSRSADSYTAEELNQMIRFGSPTGAPPPPAPAPVPAPAPAYVDDGAPVGEVSHTRVSRSERPPGVSAAPRDTLAALTLRGGYSAYGVFDFLTAGGELSVDLAKNVALVGGVEMFAVRRTPPEPLVLAEGVVAQWDFIYPMNVGLLYRIPVEHVSPYVGADFIIARYYHDDIGSDWAGGGRVRAGVTWMAVPYFGLNLNVAAGAWTGGNWSLIEPGLKTTDFLPQISAGTVFAF